MAGGRLVEHPPRSRRRKVPLPPSEHRPRPDAVDEPNRVVKVEPESILVPVRPGERLHRAPIADPLSLALDDHDLVAALEVDHDPRPIRERGYSAWPTWTSPSARLRMEEAGKRRGPPRVRECGSFPSLAHRVTVFGDT